MWSKVKSSTATALGVLAIVVLVVLVVDVLWGVFSRKILGDQARWSEELARFLLVWISFLGGAIAYLDDKHLGVDLLYTSLHGSAQRWCKVVTHFMVLLFSLGVLGFGGTRLVIDRFDSGQLMPAMEISKGWFYLAVPVSGYLIGLFAIGNVISFLVHGRGHNKEVAS